LLLLSLLLFAAASAAAQTPAMPPSGTTANVEVDPIRCWWRTSAGFVRIGETFDLSLTCAALDNEAVQVIPDESRLAPAVIQMAPFEVAGGSHPADLRSGSRRFFQYQYTLRIISPDAIGKDASLPTVVIHYTINSRVAANTAVKGRDLVYVLPQQSIRVASMVPADAADIRDAAGEDFGNVESLDFRSRVLEILALTSVAFGGLVMLIALVGYARRDTRRTPADERLVPMRGIVRAAASELAAVQRERDHEGWNETLAGRALAATRVAAACAIGRNPNQRLAGSATTGEGRLVVPGPARGKPRLLSSSMSPGDLATAIGQQSTADPGRAHMLEALRDALATFSITQYGHETPIDQTSLDSALSGAIAAARRVKGEHTWLKAFFRQLRAGGRAVETQA
jgi:hypothetical protein